MIRALLRLQDGEDRVPPRSVGEHVLAEVAFPGHADLRNPIGSPGPGNRGVVYVTSRSPILADRSSTG